LTILFAFVSPNGFADDRPLAESEINRFVEQLVSPNQAPTLDGPDAHYPANYNRESQKKVRAAWRKLRDLGPRAFPYLFDHLDDNHYSFTADAGESDYNWSVGRACFDIVRCQLEPFSVGRRPQPPNYTFHNLGKPANARKWWVTHKSKSLHELQVEAVEWVLSEIERTPDRYTEATRKDLKDSLRNLRTSKTPLKPTVPWAK
jgi:hypothetical protein